STMDRPDQNLTTPLRLKWRWDDLVCADGHRIHATFSCSVAAIDDPVEKKMLREVFGASVSSPRIVDHFNAPLGTAMRDFSSSRQVATLLDENFESKIIDALLTAAKSVAFACGLEIL